jgi:hypothetical protein
MQEYLVGFIKPSNGFAIEFFTGRENELDQWGYPSSAIRFKDFKSAAQIARRNKGSSVFVKLPGESTND